jgi:serine/threonine-protein kinase RsbW
MSSVTDEHDIASVAYRVSLSLRLPRDRVTVPVVRHLTHHALTEVGVVPSIIDDVDLALSETCANVLDHSGPGDAYDVTIEIGAQACDIRVIDVGRGFDHDSLSLAMAHPTAEEGRGLAIVHALMDDVRLSSVPEKGTVVRLVKQLSFDEDAPPRRLLLASDEPGPATSANTG